MKTVASDDEVEQFATLVAQEVATVLSKALTHYRTCQQVGEAGTAEENEILPDGAGGNRGSVRRDDGSETDGAAPSTLTEDGGNGEANTRPGGRVRRGERTPQEAYYAPIVEVLSEAGGRMKTENIYDPVHDRLSDQFVDVDYDSISSGGTRWKVTTRWARKALVEQGVLADDSPRGVWELADGWADAWKEFQEDVR